MWLEALARWAGYAPRVDLSKRADPAELPERMDDPESYEDLRECLRSLRHLNRMTGSYRPTLRFLERLARRRGAGAEPIHVLDVGSGYGDMLREIWRWGERREVALKLTGIDLQPYAARAAREADRRAGVPEGAIRWITGDAFELPGPPPDCIISSLVTHHMGDAEIVHFLRWMEATARSAWFINDLHRAERPYRWVGVLVRLMRWHRYVRHDAPASFRRAFRAEDWERLLAEAGVSAARVFEAFPARLCVERLK